ncbi:uncharacterized protein CLAFUR5_05341 [Fulvia fulva]|uniref:Uncharacterized protein n=1 Tax=Passalora fulva TaxID=5499 RepID=A0A9Q8LG92_PASFU|nr:uncharacterized protein CLAFUR5_05341 [Fulvia fulva]KAK4616662.1 hypothetical protein CLAFUR0_10738 [Fulvia fulva]UJO16825.1 hypothetical protein CLAFUR5_05341 [Fulvia fulva]
MPEARLVGEVQSNYLCFNDDLHCIITTDLDVFQNQKYRCMQDIFAVLFIEPGEGGEREPVAKIVSCDVRKTLRYAGTSQQIWRNELVGIPHNYTGTFDQHTDGSDPIDDKKKPFVLLYTRDGIPKASLGEDARAALAQKCVHYILEIVIEEDFRRKGLLPHIIFAYQKALRELPGRLVPKEAAMILSPAPMANVSDDMEGNGYHVKPYRDVVWRLAENYRWGGFETWKPFPVGVRSGLMLMGKRISDKLRDTAEDMALDEEDEEEDDDQDESIEGYEVSRRHPRSEVEVLLAEGPNRPRTVDGMYWWYDGRRWMITPESRAEDVEEGNMQQQMWQEMLDSEKTGQHPHAKIIGADDDPNMKWDIDGILGERDHHGQTLYLVEWCDILHNGQRYHLPPTWEPASMLRRRMIQEWHGIEAEQTGMLRRNRRWYRR